MSVVLTPGKLILGDSLTLVEATPLKFDTIFLDWPYSTMSPVRGKDTGAAWRVFGPMSFLHRMLNACRNAAAPGCHLYVFGDWRGIPDTGYMLGLTGWFPTTILSWNKKYVGTGGTWRSQWDPIYYATRGPEEKRTDRAFGNVIDVAADRSEDRHPAQKPADLWRKLCEASVIPGSRVLDPFAGSGSSRAPVEERGGIWHGVDVDPTWANE